MKVWETLTGRVDSQNRLQRKKGDFMDASMCWKSDWPMSELWAKPVKAQKGNNTLYLFPAGAIDNVFRQWNKITNLKPQND